ncbi:MAG: hypothetical protein KDI39_06925 [Pseudomonadales bacterium]|nr:hypothetical protein [Pseudomonadales bacterium]
MFSTSTHKTASSRRTLVLGVLLPAYVLMVCGLFSWLPVLWFNQEGHQFDITDKGAVVEWVIHHDDEHQHESSSTVENNHTDDHTLTMPCTDELKQRLIVEKLSFLLPLLLLCCCYFAWCVYPRFRLIYFPSIPIVCRNSHNAMTRTIVLRH